MENKIKSKEDYLKNFSRTEDEVKNLKENDKHYAKQAEALKSALDIRKFEIELYWKRATYFWTFIAAALAGYMLIQKSETTSKEELSLLISCLGFIFSLGWYFVNRGSKHWQNNWERHVDFLENEISGPLYKIIAKDHSETKKPTDFLIKSGEFSVSKINQIISVYVSAIWLILILKSISLSLFFTYLILPLTGLFCYLMYKYGRSGNGETNSEISIRESNIK